jgi:hypothetical protein
MRLGFVMVGLAGLIACGGGNECEAYAEAVMTCTEEAGADTTGYDVDTLCADADKAYNDYYSCLADAYSSADCSTFEGLTAAGLASMSCE